MINHKEQTAHHEAAHAVFDIMFGFGVKTVTIIPTDDYDGLCCALRPPKLYHLEDIEYEYFSDGGEITDDEYNQYEIECGSNPVGLTNEGRDTIYVLMAGYITGEILTGKPYNEDFAYKDHDYKKAIDIIVTTGAGSLDVQTAIDTLYMETKSLIIKHWDLIKAVAGALLEKKTLTGEDVETIINR